MCIDLIQNKQGEKTYFEKAVGLEIKKPAPINFPIPISPYPISEGGNLPNEIIVIRLEPDKINILSSILKSFIQAIFPILLMIGTFLIILTAPISIPAIFCYLKNKEKKEAEKPIQLQAPAVIGYEGLDDEGMPVLDDPVQLQEEIRVFNPGEEGLDFRDFERRPAPAPEPEPDGPAFMGNLAAMLR